MQNKNLKLSALSLLTVLLLAAFLLLVFGRPLWNPIYVKLNGGRTLEQAIAQYAPDAEARLMPRFEHAAADYPPKAVTLIGFKEEKRLELWAKNNDGQWRHLYNYPILAASGSAGPKLREGDRQVPEGIYQIEGLNPNSSYHLSMKINYPNAFDQQHAQAQGRDKPGTNIFIHGKAASIGCLAMGDPAIEELFVLVATVGKENTQVILLPHDPATRPLEPTQDQPEWTADLYEQLKKTIEPFR